MSGLRGSPARRRSQAGGEDDNEEPVNLKVLGFYAVLFGIVGVLIAWARQSKSQRDARIAEDFALVPNMLIIEGWIGKNRHRLNGVYYLTEDTFSGRPTWSKRAPGGGPSESSLLFDRCGAWLISPDPTGGGKKCDGWAYASGCAVPWKCDGLWKVYGGQKNGFKDVTASFLLTAHYSQEKSSFPSTGAEACTDEEEEKLVQEHQHMDIIVPWVNGSDPDWLRRRDATCRDWKKRFMWPVALKMKEHRDCVLREDSTAARKCSRRGFDEDCDLTGGVDRSKCFQEFVERNCGSRVKAIGDHGELKYMLRSLQENIPWHRGRVLLVVPRGQRPEWLRQEHQLKRLQVIDQEDLFKLAMADSLYVPHQVRGGAGGYLPDSIFNDFPVQTVIPWIPNISRYALWSDDDVIFAKPVRACDLFTRSGGLRIYADPSSTKEVDPFPAIFKHMTKHSARVWEGTLGKHGLGESKVDVYYDPYHAPRIVDTGIMRKLWAVLPEDMSIALDSPLRAPAIADLMGLHHSYVAARSRVVRQTHAEQRAAAVTRNSSWEPAGAEVLDSVIDLKEFPDRLIPLAHRWYYEVYFEAGSVKEWENLMSEILAAEPADMPNILSFQDHLDVADGSTPEVDCLREQWLLRLLPRPSDWEVDAESGSPSLCERAKWAVK